MLGELDAGLEAFFRDAVPLKKQVDISFEDLSDLAAVSGKPTLGVYLWHLKPSDVQRGAGSTLEETPGGGFVRRSPPLRLEARYLITAWGADPGDEHSLLGRVLLAVLAHERLDRKYLADDFVDGHPLPVLAVATAEDAPRLTDLWSSLDVPLRAGIDLVVTATIDAKEPLPAGPPVKEDGRDFRIGRYTPEPKPPPDEVTSTAAENDVRKRAVT